MEHYDQNVGEVTLSYSDDGAGHCIVLLHGFCGSREYFQKIIPELSEKYRVIAVDLRGHGHSSTARGDYRIEHMADDLAKLIQVLEIDKVTMIGHSLGGYVTLAFANRFSDMLHSFSLLHSTALPDDEGGKANRVKGIKRIEQEGIEGFIEDLIPKLFAPGNLEKLKGEVESAKQIGFKTSEYGAIGALVAMKNRADLQEVLKKEDLPILLIAGRNDQIIPAEKTFLHKGNHITERVLENSGHMGMLEEPGQLTEIIFEFLGKNGKQ